MLQIKHFVFSPIEENTYVVYNEENECIIIDPGCYFDEEKEALRDFIDVKKLKPVMSARMYQPPICFQKHDPDGNVY